MLDEGEKAQQPGCDGSTQPDEKWGDPISEERQAELQALFERQKAWADQPEETRGDSVFQDVELTGADVFWLMEHVERSEQYGDKAEPALDLEGVILAEAHLEGVDLTGLRLKEANLEAAHLEEASLNFALLESANLSGAELKGTTFWCAYLQRADFTDAHLEGTDFAEAHLEGADLTSATFDKTTHLKDAMMSGVSLDQTTYDGVNLTVVDWSLVPVLGDELTARERHGYGGRSKEREQHLEEFTAAVRANRVLAVTLHSQGMNEDADRYAYRAQLMQREVYRWSRHWGGFLFSWFLFLVSGYRYRLWRILASYAIVLVSFALVYLLFGVHALPHESGIRALWDSFLVSLSAIHGRTTFEQLGAWSPAAWAAAVESVFGIVIEGVFVAMLIQRFFAR